MRLALVLVATPGYDESYTHTEFVVQSWSTALSDYSLPNNHILYTLAARAIHLLTDGDLTATRLPALLAGIAAIPLTGILTYRLTRSRSAAITASATLAVWPQMIWFSANARGYTMVTMFALLLALLSHRLLQGERSLQLWLGWSVVIAAGAFTIPVFLYPAAGLGLWMLIRAWGSKQLNRRFLFEATAAGLLACLLTAIAYWPAIMNNGLDALVKNRFVIAGTWSDWRDGLGSYLRDVVGWGLRGFPVWFGILLGVLLLAGFIRHGRRSEAHMLLLTLVITSIGIMAVQRLAPFPRIWLFLIPFVAAALGNIARLPQGGVGLGFGAAFLCLVIGVFAVQLPDPESQLRSMEKVPEIDSVVRIAAETFPEGSRLIVGRSEIPQYQYVTSKYPTVSMDDGPGIVIVVNHRLGYELTELLQGTEFDVAETRLLVNLPNTTLYSLAAGS